MLIYPHINPIMLSLGPIKLHWYGFMYLVGFVSAWFLLNYRAKKFPQIGFTREIIDDIIFYAACGVIIGGRLGYMLFYDLPDFLADPLIIFKIWQGGMSFHGGFLGVIAAIALFSHYKRFHFSVIMDFIVPVVPLGLAAGRLGNFINGELWGRVTHMPWGMIFPQAGLLPRHPSQLYEFLLEGICLFVLLWCFSRKQRPRLAVSALFLVGYSFARIFCEIFRQPDPQLGFIAFHDITMGQILSLPMLLLGIGLLTSAYKNPRFYTLRKDH